MLLVELYVFSCMSNDKLQKLFEYIICDISYILTYGKSDFSEKEKKGKRNKKTCYVYRISQEKPVRTTFSVPYIQFILVECRTSVHGATVPLPAVFFYTDWYTKCFVFWSNITAVT
jgi:hypothetical protein